MDNETLIAYGGGIKSLGLNDDGYEKFSGFLVRYGTAANADTSRFRDYFTKDTDYDAKDGDIATFYYHHGLSDTFGVKKLATGPMTFVDEGIMVSWGMKAANQDEQRLIDKMKRGEMGLSSGVLPNLVQRQPPLKYGTAPDGRVHKVTHWPLGSDASITPTPADKRCIIGNLKSAMEIDSDFALGDGIKADDIDATPAATPELIELETGTLDGLKFSDHSVRAIAAMREYAERFGDLISHKVSDGNGGIKAGATLSQSNYDRLSGHHADLLASVTKMGEWLAQYKPVGLEPTKQDDLPADAPPVMEIPQAVQRFKVIQSKMNV